VCVNRYSLLTPPSPPPSGRGHAACPNTKSSSARSVLPKATKKLRDNIPSLENVKRKKHSRSRDQPRASGERRSAATMRRDLVPHRIARVGTRHCPNFGGFQSEGGCRGCM